MIQVQAQRRFPWAMVAWWIAVGIGAVLAIVHASMGLFLVALVVATVLAAGVWGLSGAHTGRTTVRGAAAPFATAPRTQRVIAAADGMSRAAIVVPVEQPDGFEFVLTKQGYVLVNRAGEEVYALKR